MVVCNGRGDRDGGHCCYIGGEVCEFLFTDRGGTPRCSIWDEMDSDRWRATPGVTIDFSADKITVIGGSPP